MYYKLASRPNHNQSRFMPSFASVVHNQFPRAEFFNDQVRISHVLLFDERVVLLQPPNPAPVATVNLQPVTPPPAAATSTTPDNSAEDDLLRDTIQSLRDAVRGATNNTTEGSVQQNPLTPIDDHLRRAVLDLATLVQRNASLRPN